MKSRAFTLIELLVVVLIIGILSAIALPQYQKAVIKTKYTTLKPLVRAIADAEEIYYLANGKYTSDVDELALDWPELPAEKDCNERGCEYTFSWGYCSLNDPTGSERIVCENASAYLRYRRTLKHSNYPFVEGCGASPSSQKAKEVCQAESGKKQADYQDKDVEYYFW